MDPEQGADLHDELKEENHQSTLVTLLNIFYQTFAMEQTAAHTCLLSTFTEGRPSRLTNDIRHYIAIVISRQSRLPTLLQNFTQYTRATNSVAKLVTDSILETALSYHQIRRQIFDLAIVIGLMYARKRTFVRHGYIQPLQFPVNAYDCNGWEKSNDEWVAEGEKFREAVMEKETRWGVMEEETNERWAKVFAEEWVKALPGRLNTEYLDLQA